jgi:hypothetical protein
MTDRPIVSRAWSDNRSRISHIVYEHIIALDTSRKHHLKQV